MSKLINKIVYAIVVSAAIVYGITFLLAVLLVPLAAIAWSYGILF